VLVAILLLDLMLRKNRSPSGSSGDIGDLIYGKGSGCGE